MTITVAEFTSHLTGQLALANKYAEDGAVLTSINNVLCIHNENVNLDVVTDVLLEIIDNRLEGRVSYLTNDIEHTVDGVSHTVTIEDAVIYVGNEESNNEANVIINYDSRVGVFVDGVKKFNFIMITAVDNPVFMIALDHKMVLNKNVKYIHLLADKVMKKIRDMQETPED